jgi:hypothetical protein
MAERARAQKKSKAPKGKNGTAKAGHNSGEVADEIILRWNSKIEVAANAAQRAKDAHDSAKGRLQSIYKAAKDDGVDIDALKEVRKMDKGDHAEVELRYRNTGRYLRVLESKLAVQFELFPEVKQSAAVGAWLAGSRAGKAGEPVENNPHTVGSAPFEEYDQGWRHGQQLLAKEKFGASP